MNTTMTSNGQKRKRTKQTLAAPRQVLRKDGFHDFNKLVWVLVGKTEHQAWLLEELADRDMVMIRWESTRLKERVPVLSIRLDLPGRSSRRRQAQIFRYDESFEIEGASGRSAPRKLRKKTGRTKNAREEKKPTTYRKNQLPLQASFVPEKKLFVEERSASNEAKHSWADALREKPVSTVKSRGSLLSSNPGGPLKKRGCVSPSMPSGHQGLIVPGTEFLDDMALVSHFMSILSRLDDQSESSDDEQDDSNEDDIESSDAKVSRKTRFPSEDPRQRYESCQSCVGEPRSCE
jgi:hypothetical protein